MKKRNKTDYLILTTGVGLLLGTCSGHLRADPPPFHLGSSVIFTRYEEQWPQIIGTKAAAILVSEPFICPISHPHAGGICANLRFFTTSPNDPENGDPVQCDSGVCNGWINAGGDFKFSVWYDANGKTNRSFHVYGEGENE